MFLSSFSLVLSFYIFHRFPCDPLSIREHWSSVSESSKSVLFGALAIGAMSLTDWPLLTVGAKVHFFRCNEQWSVPSRSHHYQHHLQLSVFAVRLITCSNLFSLQHTHLTELTIAVCLPVQRQIHRQPLRLSDYRPVPSESDSLASAQALIAVLPWWLPLWRRPS